MSSLFLALCILTSCFCLAWLAHWRFLPLNSVMTSSLTVKSPSNTSYLEPETPELAGGETKLLSQLQVEKP